MNKIRIRNKVWLEINGQPLLGDGRSRLLQAIAATGSINAACEQLDMSYRKAWAQLQEMEKLSPFPILKRSKGGKGGGCTELTTGTKALLTEFTKLRDVVDEKLADCRQLDFPLTSLEVEP